MVYIPSNTTLHHGFIWGGRQKWYYTRATLHLYYHNCLYKYLHKYLQNIDMQLTHKKKVQHSLETLLERPRPQLLQGREAYWFPEEKYYFNDNNTKDNIYFINNKIWNGKGVESLVSNFLNRKIYIYGISTFSVHVKCQLQQSTRLYMFTGEMVYIQPNYIF